MQKNLLSFLGLCLFSYPAHAVFKQPDNPPAKETITIVADTWCPYNCNPKSPHRGFLVDLITTAFAKHNIDVNYSVMPWADAIAETRKGLHTAIIGAAMGDAPDFIFPTINQAFMQNHFYVKKGNPWRYDGIKSLNGIVLGLIVGYSYNDEIDSYIEKYKFDTNHIEMMAGDEALGINLSKIVRGKIGATLEAKYVVDYYLSLHNMKDDIDDAGQLPPSDKNNLYMAFGPTNKKLAQKYADIISDETKKMRASGELEKIMDVYGLDDWEKK